LPISTLSLHDALPISPRYRYRLTRPCSVTFSLIKKVSGVVVFVRVKPQAFSDSRTFPCLTISLAKLEWFSPSYPTLLCCTQRVEGPALALCLLAWRIF